MRNAIDFTSWEGLLSTVLGLAVFSLVVVGIRLLVMHTVQLKRERENRQINERLRTLIAAYKTLGGSFTGSLAVDPTHLRDLHARAEDEHNGIEDRGGGESAASKDAQRLREPTSGFDRRRRIRDAVEAALSDVILLGTEEQVKLASSAANDMVAGRAVETAELVVSLRTFIRQVLDLDAVPAEVAIPKQGPARPGDGGGRGARDERGRGARDERGRGGGTGGAGGGQGAGIGAIGLGAGEHHDAIESDSSSHS